MAQLPAWLRSTEQSQFLENVDLGWELIRVVCNLFTSRAPISCAPVPACPSDGLHACITELDYVSFDNACNHAVSRTRSYMCYSELYYPR